VEPSDDVGLDDGEPLPGPVFQVLLYFLVIESLKQQPGGVAEAKERLAVLVDEVVTVGAYFQPHPLDRTVGIKAWGLGPRIGHSPGRRRRLRWGVQRRPTPDRQCEGRWGTGPAQPTSIPHAVLLVRGSLKKGVRADRGTAVLDCQSRLA